MLQQRVNLDLIDPLIFDEEMRRIYKKAQRLLATCPYPLYFSGPPGTGKTALAQNLMKWWVEAVTQGTRGAHIPEAHLIQLSPDIGKEVLVGGMRMVAGSYVPVNGVIAEVMEKGAILFIDEVPHADHDVQLLLNTPFEKGGIISFGEKTITRHPFSRFLLAGNTTSVLGNHTLSQSLARRLCEMKVGYPSRELEGEIALSMVKNDLDRSPIKLSKETTLKVPRAVVLYLVSYIREIREKYVGYPLSASSLAVMLHQLQADYELEGTGGDLDPIFTERASGGGEALQRRIYQRIHPNKIAPSSTVLVHDQELKDFLGFVAYIGKETFVESVLSGAYAHLSLAGTRVQTELKNDLGALLF